MCRSFGHARASVAAAAARLHLERSLASILVFGFVIGVGQAIGQVSMPIDAVIYWRADLTDLYDENWAAYVYAPPLAQVLAPLHALPYAVFIITWTTLLFGCLWYCARWLTWPLIAVGFAAAGGILPRPFGVVLGSVLLGNVTMLLAACVVAGIRRPGVLAIPMLTKVGPGVSYLWPLARGEWRAFGRASAALVAVIGISFALGPNLWASYLTFLADNWNAASPIPVVAVPWSLRLALACVIVIIAARIDRAWLVPFAAGLAVPALYGWLGMVPYAVGVVALGRYAPNSRATASSIRRLMDACQPRRRAPARRQVSPWAVDVVEG